MGFKSIQAHFTNSLIRGGLGVHSLVLLEHLIEISDLARRNRRLGEKERIDARRVPAHLISR